MCEHDLFAIMLMSNLDNILGSGRPKWTNNVRYMRGNPTKETDTMLQYITTVGAGSLVLNAIHNWKVDIGKVRRVPAVMYLIQKIQDEISTSEIQIQLIMRV